MGPVCRADNSAVLVLPNVKVRIEVQHSISMTCEGKLWGRGGVGGSWESIEDQAADWTTAESCTDSQERNNIFVFSKMFIPALGHSQLPVQWLLGALSLVHLATRL